MYTWWLVCSCRSGSKIGKMNEKMLLQKIDIYAKKEGRCKTQRTRWKTQRDVRDSVLMADA